MVKAIVVYESKYGNTKLVAESIVEGMNQVTGMEAALVEVHDVDLTQIDEFDVVLVGSPHCFRCRLRCCKTCSIHPQKNG